MNPCTLIQANGRPKAQFATKAAADLRLAEILAYNRAHGLGNRTKEPVRSYGDCHACDAWHLTNRPAPVAAPVRRTVSPAEAARLRRANGLA